MATFHVSCKMKLMWPPDSAKANLLLVLVIHVNLSYYRRKQTGSADSFVKLICHFVTSLFYSFKHSLIQIGYCVVTFTDKIIKKNFWIKRSDEIDTLSVFLDKYLGTYFANMSL